MITNARAGAVLAANLGHSFQRVLSNVGLPHCGLHSLRHTFAGLLFAASTNITVISKLPGHASVKITYDTYASTCAADHSELFHWHDHPANVHISH